MKRRIRNSYFKKFNDKRIILISLSVVLIFIVAMNGLFVYNTGFVVKEKIAKLKEESRPAVLKITKIDLASCEDCFDINVHLNSIKSSEKTNVTEEKLIIFPSQEAQELIEKYSIDKLPTLIIEGEVNKSNVASNFNNLRKFDDNTVIFNQQKPPFYDVQEKRVVGRVEITKLIDESCLNCFDIENVISFFKQAGVTISNERNVNYDSAEGQNLIQKYGIKKIPALVISKDITEYDSLQQIWPQLNAVEKNGFYVLHALQPPFRDISQDKIVGLVDLIMLEDKSCSECHDVSVNKQILARFGITPNTEKTYDVSSTEGQELISKYSIEKVPTILLSPEAKAYTSFVQAWQQVGEIDEDGWFVMRKPEIIGIVKNLTSGELIDLRS